MHCSRCGFQLKDSANFCSKCGNQTIENSSKVTEKISTSDLDTDSNEINSKQNSIERKLLIGILIIIVLLSVGFGSYYISFSRLSANNSKNSISTFLKNDITPNKKPKISSDTVASTNKTNKAKSSESYIFAKSGSIKLFNSDLSELSKENLTLARNEIFARHGFIFQTEPFKSYFNNKSWYKPNSNFKGSDAELNDVELYNVRLLLKFENK